jgi:hypothetical protein
VGTFVAWSSTAGNCRRVKTNSAQATPLVTRLTAAKVSWMLTPRLIDTVLAGLSEACLTASNRLPTVCVGAKTKIRIFCQVHGLACVQASTAQPPLLDPVDDVCPEASVVLTRDPFVQMYVRIIHCSSRGCYAESGPRIGSGCSTIEARTCVG